MSPDALDRARAAYDRRDWRRAFELLQAADAAASLDIDDLWRLGWSAALGGHDAVVLQTLERLYQAHVDRGECLRGARAAFWAGMNLVASGDVARGGGWLGRAQRLVEREGADCVEQGFLMLPHVFRHLAASEDDAAAALAARAAAIGERFAESDLIALARNLEGRALMRQGRVVAGLALLDEVLVAVTSGDVSPFVSGLVYCTVIASCQQMCALDRARAWSAALCAWCDGQPELDSFTGSCLVHRAEILQLGGEWQQALDEARRARERAATSAGTLAESHYQQAEVHRLRGELDAAEEAYRSASELGGETQPGLALLRLAQGRTDEAVGAIRRVLGTTTAAWQRARFLPACVEIMLATGKLDEARTASEELAQMARRFDTEVLAAMAAHARGALHLATGNAQAAVEPLRRAFAVWHQIGAPYIAARIRVLVAEACRALGDPDGAELERAAARQVFERLGAAPDLAALDAVDVATSSRVHGLTGRELQVLRLIATGKSNKEIGRELFVSERTIDRHVANIFNKLDLHSRAAATAFAYEHDLV